MQKKSRKKNARQRPRASDEFVPGGHVLDSASARGTGGMEEEKSREEYSKAKGIEYRI